MLAQRMRTVEVMSLLQTLQMNKVLRDEPESAELGADLALVMRPMAARRRASQEREPGAMKPRDGACVVVKKSRLQVK